MTTDEIQALLAAVFPEADVIEVQGEGAKFTVTVVSSRFETLRPVAKQQAVYAPLNPHIATGAIHAVTMRLFTPEEWRKARLFG